jgi:F0F1-type ATP synthase assembly protein I
MAFWKDKYPMVFFSGFLLGAGLCDLLLGYATSVPMGMVGGAAAIVLSLALIAVALYKG